MSDLLRVGRTHTGTIADGLISLLDAESTEERAAIMLIAEMVLALRNAHTKD